MPTQSVHLNTSPLAPGAGATGPGPDRVVRLLAGLLLACPQFRLPGADGQTVADVVAAEYPPAAAAGWVPGAVALAAEYPDMAGCLAVFVRACSVPAGIA